MNELISTTTLRKLSQKNKYTMKNWSKEDLSKILILYSNRANKRLNNIAKAGLTKSSSAYRFVQNKGYSERKSTYKNQNKMITKKDRFSKAVSSKSYGQIVEQLQTLDTFLFESKTSTVKGTKDVNKKRYEASLKYLEKNNPELADKFKEIAKNKDGMDEIGDIWRSSSMNNLIKMYGSEMALDIYEDLTKEGASNDELNTLIEKYLDENEDDEEHPFLELEDYVIDNMNKSDELESIVDNI